MEFLTTEQLPKTKAGLKKALISGNIKAYEINDLSESLENEFVLVTNLDYLFSTWDIFHYRPKSARASLGSSRRYFFK
jgi:hypothetical protein